MRYHRGNGTYDVGISQSLGHLVAREALDLSISDTMSPSEVCWLAACLGLGGDVAEVSGDTGGDGSNVVQRQLSDVGVQLEQQRERLADTARSADHGDLRSMAQSPG